MTTTEKIFNEVSRVTGIAVTKMKSPSREWPIVEARMLFILYMARDGASDEKIALALCRARPTVTRSRHNAAQYLTASKSFREKFNKIFQTDYSTD
ncbi:MAG: hypothetical protein K2M98_04820 [Muribaculum sp.]|nr:hypothetical protein [Muribaculum sp.]